MIRPQAARRPQCAVKWDQNLKPKQEAFEKCWAHSLLQAAACPFIRCRYCRMRASMSTTTTTTTTRDRGDRYGPTEWAQLAIMRQCTSITDRQTDVRTDRRTLTS